jgi:hypothetical protein
MLTGFLHTIWSDMTNFAIMMASRNKLLKSLSHKRRDRPRLRSSHTRIIFNFLTLIHTNRNKSTLTDRDKDA